MLSHTNTHFVLDGILSAALEMRQKYPNIVIILKQVDALGAVTSLSARLFHQLLITVIETIYQPRSKQTNVIMLIHTSKQNQQLYIRCQSSSIPTKHTWQLSESNYQSIIVQHTIAPSSISIIIPESPSDTQSLV